MTLSDATDPPANGLRLSILMPSIDTARMQRRLCIPDLDAILPACGPVQQLCNVGCEDGVGQISLNALAKYMARDGQVTITIIITFLTDESFRLP